jgi:hypothetical protein
MRPNLYLLKSAKLWTLVTFLYLLRRLSESLEVVTSAALRPRAEPCGSEKMIEGGVELTGIEPVASGLQSPRSPS